MRFLLKVAQNTSKKSKPTTPVVAVASGKTYPTSWSASSNKQLAEDPSSTAASTKKAWGQQCSPNCGCVLRFEAQVSSDDPQQRVLKASYHAKQVVTHCVDGQLVPVHTNTRKGRQPLMTDCQCDSLHTLATQVVKKLTDAPSWSRISNSLEVTGLRSSLALQHAILRTHDLNPKKDGNCFDLVEEALVRMIREQPLPPRKQDDTANKSFTDVVRAYYSRSSSSSLYNNNSNNDSYALESITSVVRFDDHYSSQDEETVSRYGRALRRIQRAKAIQQQRQQQGKDRGLSAAATPRTISALHMFDLSQDPADMLQEYEEHAAAQHQNSSSSGSSSSKPSNSDVSSPSIDWEQYVDEMNQAEEQQKTA
mmetsp:Transcript_46347/g.69011  ORF Transcript_46347/g.69011 Transcript_46347/m.69011 type:complete len:366 (-) Transcript_46347:128-1225(-)|eukprot:CAMPEP_0194040150 /NCGR_PEP_ID=MMETSP0009_2-20130614/12197_1 /TAXON_ID=210454 /ORGANISM="Grammatophora oceanica, Strain CCMP 410" /LENGTH=365 /DNA_ID=CAMNT_0038683195 /DNA_START=119 /DNA_END=1216 /DNA_ORIENTATION=+